jgi:hypothetical protein
MSSKKLTTDKYTGEREKLRKEESMEEELNKISNKIKETEKGIKGLERNLKKVLRLAKVPLQNIYKIEPLVENLEKAINETEFDRVRLLEVMGILKRDIERLKDDFRFDFSKRLNEGLQKKGMDLRGNLPVLHTSFYRIEANFMGGKVNIMFGPEKIARCALSPEEIVGTLRKIDEELQKNSIPEEEFIDRLFQGWKRAFLISQKERIPITTVLTELTLLLQKKQFYENPSKRNYREYPRYQFAYDVYKLRKKGIKEIHGKELHLIASTFDATRKKIDYIWIPINERGEGINYSYVTFK